MAIQPITDESGIVVDEYDDEQSNFPPEANQQPESEPVDKDALEAGHLESHSDQPEAVTSTISQATGMGKVLKEDTTDFDQSDIVIQLLLHRHDGHPQGRLVSVLIHNFSGSPVAQDFREADLSNTARLDSIQQAILPVMQRFLLDLAGRKQKKLEEETRRTPRPLPQSIPPSKTTGGTSQSASKPSTVPSAPKQPPATANVSKEEPKKKDADKKSKYQQIALF